MSTAILLTLLLTAGGDSPQAAPPISRLVATASAEHVATLPEPVVIEIEVREWGNQPLIEPDYRVEHDTWLGVPLAPIEPIRSYLGVPSGGSSGSPSFDPILRKYWWE